MSTELKYETGLVACYGRRSGDMYGEARDKFVIGFTRLDPNAKDQTRLPHRADFGYPDKAPWSRMQAGAIYELTYSVTPEGKREVFVRGEHGPQFVRMIEDEAVAAAWRLEEQAANVCKRIASAERKAAGDALAALDPLRDVYRRSHGDSRAALEAVVLRYLRS